MSRFEDDPGRHPMSLTRWSLRERYRVEDHPTGDLVITAGQWAMRIADPGPIVRELLRRMALGPISLDNVLSGTSAADRDRQSAYLHQVLDDLDGAVARSLELDDGRGPLLSLESDDGRPPPLRIPSVDPDRPVAWAPGVALSFAPGGGARLSCPGSYRAVLHRRSAMAVAMALREPRTIAELAGWTGANQEVTEAITGHLLAVELVVYAT